MDGGGENVSHAGVMFVGGDDLQAGVELIRISRFQLRHAADAQQGKIGQRCFAYIARYYT